MELVDNATRSPSDWMNIADIIRLPRVVTREMIEDSQGVHESCLFSYALLQYVRYLVREGVPARVVVKFITDMEDANRRQVQ